MDEAVKKYYRRLLTNGFDYIGSFETPSIFLDSIGENIPICSQIGRDYLNVYIRVNNGTIDDIRYMCLCDPTANVVVEVLCSLVIGKTLEAVKAIKEDAFVQAIGGSSEELLKKIRGAIELINRGLTRYESSAG